MEQYFEIPLIKKLTNHNNWQKQGDRDFFIVRAFFKTVTSHMPGASQLGRKMEPFGSPGEHERIKRVVSEREIFNEQKTIEKSLVESQALVKIVSEVSAKFGFEKSSNVSRKMSSEISGSIKKTFHKEFQVTGAIRDRKEITFKFKDTIRKDDMDRLCYAEVYQECRADLYLLRIDFLHVKYVKTKFGLRKKITKNPFPRLPSLKEDHPNIIRIGVPVAELNYWQLLPGSSVVVKDKEYVQEVENDAEIIVKPPREFLPERPYWTPPKYPSLYQVSRIAFPTKYIDIKDKEFTREELIKHEFGEAEETAWWYMYGPGQKTKKHKKQRGQETEGTVLK
jgi:Lhr-like helicase